MATVLEAIEAFKNSVTVEIDGIVADIEALKILVQSGATAEEVEAALNPILVRLQNLNAEN